MAHLSSDGKGASGFGLPACSGFGLRTTDSKPSILVLRRAAMTVSCRKSNNRERTRAARGRIPLTGAILLLALAVAACELKSLPTAPSELTSGLTIYLDANYLGESALLTHSID